VSDVPPLSTNEAQTWVAGRLPETWFSAVEVFTDRDEILILGHLPCPTGVAAEDVIAEFRRTTRDQRIGVAKEAQSRYGREVSWAAQCAETRVMFTHLSVPVMTRLRITERSTLDTLVAAGVARSRSDALGWCVRLVAEHEAEWLAELQEAISTVEQIRDNR
jgi:hypothetical protein